MGLPKDSNLNLYSKWKPGERNLITDVTGVKVGNVTVEDDEKNIHTGVTAVLPHEGNLFQDKVMAGVSVINGFGKSIGLIQIDEIGTIEVGKKANLVFVDDLFHVQKVMLEGNFWQK